MDRLEELLHKTQEKSIRISVIGLGRVGLPLASVLASKGFKVNGIDVNTDTIESIKNSKCPFYDPSLQDNLEETVKSGNLTVGTKMESNFNVLFLSVGTPKTEGNTVDYSQLFNALNEIVKADILGKLIILRSTLPPKTTEDVIIPFLEDKSSLRCGKDFGLAVCPERILEGKAIRELNQLPEIIGGVNEICNNIVKSIFQEINPDKEFVITSPTGAELTKLFTNIYRYIGFALANELAIWSEMYGVDATEVIKGANYNYERCNIPIPGFAGGPCLSKDGTFLDNNTTFSSIVSTAWKLNESIPQHVINSIKKNIGNLYNKKIAVLGLSFKSGSDDLRNSPSLKLVGILKTTGAKVIVHDPYVKDTISLKQALENSEVVIIATNHKEFQNIKEEINQSKPKLIYDVWSMYESKDYPSLEYHRFGDGSL